MARQRAFLVSEKSPSGKMTAKVRAVNYDPRYYSNDQDFANGVIGDDGYGAGGGYESATGDEWGTEIGGGGGDPSPYYLAVGLTNSGLGGESVGGTVYYYPSGLAVAEAPIFPTASYGPCFSPNGALLAIAHNRVSSSPYLTVYNTSDWSEVTAVIEADPGGGGGRSTCFSDDGSLLAWTQASSPRVEVFNVSDWTKQPYPASQPEGDPSFGSAGISFNPAGTRMLVVYNAFGAARIRNYNTSSWAAMAVGTPALPSAFIHAVQFSPDGSMYAVGHENSPRLSIYNFTTLTRNAALASPPSSTVRGVAWSPDGSLLAVVCQSSPYVIVYNTSDWSRRSDPAELPTGGGRSVKFSPNGEYLAVGHDVTPFVTVYNVSDWSKRPNLDPLPDYGAWGLAWGTRPV